MKKMQWGKLTPTHIIVYLQTHLCNCISVCLNKRFEKKCRTRIKNQQFSIICPTCIGGVIYHRLGMKFLSPTINLWMNRRDFIKLVQNLQYYMKQELRFVESEYNYPVAELGENDGVKIFFNHAKTEEEARKSWNSRRGRINYSNLYIIAYDGDNITREDILELEQIACKRLIVLSEHKYQNIAYVKTIQKPAVSRLNDCSFLDKDLWGFRTFEKQFDFVAWLNGEKDY